MDRTSQLAPSLRPLDDAERDRRIALDFPLDTADVTAALRERMDEVTDDDVAHWTASGALENLVIDGQRRYLDRAVPNLLRLDAKAAERAGWTPDPGPMHRPTDHHRALVAGSDDVAQRVRVRHRIEVPADAVPDGEQVRAWLPYPLELPGRQDDLILLGTTPDDPMVAATTAPHRTVHLTAPARSGRPTTFELGYEVTITGMCHNLRAEGGEPAPGSAAGPDPQDFLGERAPHVVFTDAVRAFSDRVVGTETDPLRIAWSLYKAVDAIPWAGAREYSTLIGIPDHVLACGHGDCGQQTLLLMTLLRLNGIPSRWESGWVFGDAARPDYNNMHDWGWCHLGEWGWVPLDVTTGCFDVDEADLASFYFGGLDSHRIACNADFGAAFEPPKTWARSDDVDSQRGEVEWAGGNLYYDQWHHDVSTQLC